MSERRLGRPNRLGAVAIGRNEGERLETCLRSLRLETGGVDAVVYVDSGSDDASVARARDLGAQVVELDPALPFTAARARNAGFERLREILPELEWVQFIDGDCELRDEWLAKACQHLAAHPEVAVVCGRRRERWPEASVYNRVTDVEWNTPVGDATACGGDALMRADVLATLRGFDPTLIAGEEPELCQRIRNAGHRVARIDVEMTLHDAAMMHFSQWYQRQVRAGHAYAEVGLLHRASGYRQRELLSILFWGGAVPAASLLLILPTQGFSLLLWLAYPALVWRILRSRPERLAGFDGMAYALACVVAKPAHFQGVLTFLANRFLLRRRTQLIEYKVP